VITFTMSALVLFASAAPAQATEIFFEAPGDATDLQLRQAAKSLAARCDALDLKGVTGAPASREEDATKRIRLAFPKGHPKENLKAVDFMASFPAAKVDLRIIHKVGKSDTSRYPPGGAAPDGATWVKTLEWNRTADPFPLYRKTDKESFWLLRDQPVLEGTGQVKVFHHGGGDFYRQKLEAGVYLEFSKDLTRALFSTVTKDPDDPKKDVLLVALFIDDVKMVTGGGAMRWYLTSTPNDGKTPDKGLWSIEELTKSRTLQVLLKHPLPFALKRAG